MKGKGGRDKIRQLMKIDARCMDPWPIYVAI